MRITQVSIRNFRGIASLDLAVESNSLLLLGANGSGKTAVLSAIAKALGLDRGLQWQELVDPTQPAEITVTLNDLGAELAGTFSQRATFGPGGPTLTIGMHAVIDGPEVEVTHGFPNASWARATREQLRAIPVVALGADRQHSKLLQMVGARSLLAGLIDALDLDGPIDAAGDALALAAEDLANAGPLVELLSAGSAELGGVLSDAAADAFGLRAGAPIDLLRQLELTLEYSGRRAGLAEQPSGLSQLAIFAVGLVTLRRRPGTVLLLDEPELSLHPQAQRALISRIQDTGAQVLMATHSAHALARWDLRQAVRLESTGGGAAARSPGHVSDQEERRLTRYATANLAEAFFARTVVFVEGPGDRLALRVAAETLGVELDAQGVSIVELDGADLFSTMYTLLGPGGLRIRVVGLCDADREVSWANTVIGSGAYAGDRSVLAQHGVHVLDPDIEGALVGALGGTRTEAVIEQDGAANALAQFRQQPNQAHGSSEEQLVRFVKKGKARWPPLLVGELSDTEIPSPVRDLLADV